MSDRKYGDGSDPDVDAGIRALRDTPPSADAMARMRAGLAERIAGEAGGEAPDAPVVSIEAHPRWRRWIGPLAAAAAALALFFLLTSREPTPRDAFETAGQVGDSPADAGVVEPGAAPESSQAIAGEHAPAPRDGLAPPATHMAVDDAPPPGAPDAVSPRVAETALEQASDEEIAVALEYDLLRDYDVIAQLDLLELLDEIEAEGAFDGGGRI